MSWKNVYAFREDNILDLKKNAYEIKGNCPAIALIYLRGHIDLFTTEWVVH